MQCYFMINFMVFICPLDFKCLLQFWELAHKWQSVWTRSSGHILSLFHLESKQCHWSFAVHSLHSLQISKTLRCFWQTISKMYTTWCHRQPISNSNANFSPHTITLVIQIRSLDTFKHQGQSFHFPSFFFFFNNIWMSRIFALGINFHFNI